MLWSITIFFVWDVRFEVFRFRHCIPISLPFLRRRASNHRECVRTTFWVEKVLSSRLEDGLVGMLFEQLYVYSGSPTNRASTVLVVVCVQQVRHVHLFSFMLLSVYSFLLNDPCPYILSGLPSLFLKALSCTNTKLNWFEWWMNWYHFNDSEHTSFCGFAIVN